MSTLNNARRELLTRKSSDSLLSRLVNINSQRCCPKLRNHQHKSQRRRERKWPNGDEDDVDYEGSRRVVITVLIPPKCPRAIIPCQLFTRERESAMKNTLTVAFRSCDFFPLQFTAWTLQWMLETVKKNVSYIVVERRNVARFGLCDSETTEWTYRVGSWQLLCLVQYTVSFIYCMKNDGDAREKRMEMIVWRRWRRQKGKESSWNVYILCKFKDVFEHI